ncbi:DUF192 domain-containing protein [Winogradskyella sp. DF17]|jgi:uncharacterized membrane protein (UPF0127 family)|uniref:DUF192 domain-containing protein n=1 Tax=Winogradskyella pelagia TaxID=2819984 RepID=A0ABS3T335_9FLAO|nr:DUF192 domain-containing protein [Winogradskyella sp. DF17]MBO3117153.1 DUF192 domain-containing protein [Winogradskyella sp. DF17]
MNRLLRKGIALALITLSFSHCKEKKTTSPTTKVTIPFKKEGTLSLIKSSSDSIIAKLDIEVADNEYETQTGLMYRTELKTNHGMLFIFPDVSYRSFYMKNTKIPLDIIYLDETKTIISIQKNAQPFNEASLPSEAPAKYVLEVNAGLSDTWQLAKGDTMLFEIE